MPTLAQPQEAPAALVTVRRRAARAAAKAARSGRPLLTPEERTAIRRAAGQKWAASRPKLDPAEAQARQKARVQQANAAKKARNHAPIPRPQVLGRCCWWELPAGHQRLLGVLHRLGCSPEQLADWQAHLAKYDPS